MTIEVDIWTLYDIALRKYVRPTKDLCGELASGEFDNDALSERLQSIQRSPEIDQSTTEYFYIGRAFEELSMPELVINPMEYNPLRYWVVIADAFHVEMKKAGDPPDFDRIRMAAKKYWEEFQTLNEQWLKKVVILAGKLSGGQQSGITAELSVPPVASPATATELKQEGTVGVPIVVVPIIKKTLKSAVIEWKGTRTRVDLKTAEAFEAMIAAKVLPVGLGEIVGKPSKWLKKLSELEPELAAIVARGKGKSGYRITIFDPPSDSV